MAISFASQTILLKMGMSDLNPSRETELDYK